MPEVTSAIFDLLDRWRHLPDYQLERRADIFFAAFLPQFLASRFGLADPLKLVPEFPVRIGTVYPHIPVNRSFKIDYLAVTTTLEKAFLVELKTDSSSRRTKQDEYLEAARQIGLHKLLEGVVRIVKATQAKHKYCCLLRMLADIELLRLPAELAAPSPKLDAREINRLLPAIEIIAPEPELRIQYLQPQADGSDDINFEELASWLEGRSDAVAARFAKSLREWKAITAGRPA
jgi:hypothetical protein